jgi:hypothetical protein
MVDARSTGPNKLSSSRISSIVNAIRSLYRWGKERELADFDPAKEIRLPASGAKPRDRVATPAEFGKLIAAIFETTPAERKKARPATATPLAKTRSRSRWLATAAPPPGDPDIRLGTPQPRRRRGRARRRRGRSKARRLLAGDLLHAAAQRDRRRRIRTRASSRRRRRVALAEALDTVLVTADGRIERASGINCEIAVLD